MGWFAVRSVLQHEDAFEERVTLWSASSAEEAVAKAEAEVADYATGLGLKHLDLFQSYELPDPPADGAEVFSLIRPSVLRAEAYLDRFFDTGEEFQQHLD